MDLKEVTHIESRTGPRGGDYWLLTLACGHLVSKRKPRFRPDQPLTSISGRAFARAFAPKRAKCHYCEIKRGASRASLPTKGEFGNLEAQMNPKGQQQPFESNVEPLHPDPPGIFDPRFPYG